jgi:uncharacterized protein (TIGR00730 family)
MNIKRVCVYCGSNSGSLPAFAGAARDMGAALARRGLGLVYGGGCVGLMGLVADAMVAEGGEVIGVIPEVLAKKEIAHFGLKDLRVVGTIHERKALMAELADAFIALPGGFGTMEEFCEALTWSQIGLHDKPLGLLNVAGFYGPLLAFFDHAVERNFIRPAHRQLVLAETDPDRLLDLLAQSQTPALHKWMDRDET